MRNHHKARDKSSPQFLSHQKRVRDAFGHWRAINLTAEPEAVDKYINRCKEAGMAPSSINRGTQLLAQAFKLSIESRRLNTAPVIRHLPERNARQGFFEDADFNNVVAALPGYLQDFARFAYLVGWRKGEIAFLLWSDVDNDIIRLRPEHSKNGIGRSAPLHDSNFKHTEVRVCSVIPSDMCTRGSTARYRSLPGIVATNLTPRRLDENGIFQATEGHAPSREN